MLNELMDGTYTPIGASFSGWVSPHGLLCKVQPSGFARLIRSETANISEPYTTCPGIVVTILKEP
jgi:hypothetical protein